MLLLFIVFVLYLSCEKNENKQKEAGIGPFLKKQLVVEAHLKVWLLPTQEDPGLNTVVYKIY